MQYRVTISYEALDKSGDAEGGSKTWKITADNSRSAIEEALNNLEQRIKVRVAPTAELLDVKIDCKLMEDPEASYNRIVQGEGNIAQKQKLEEVKKKHNPPDGKLIIKIKPGDIVKFNNLKAEPIPLALQPEIKVYPVEPGKVLTVKGKDHNARVKIYSEIHSFSLWVSIFDVYDAVAYE